MPKLCKFDFKTVPYEVTPNSWILLLRKLLLKTDWIKRRKKHFLNSRFLHALNSNTSITFWKNHADVFDSPGYKILLRRGGKLARAKQKLFKLPFTSCPLRANVFRSQPTFLGGIRVNTEIVNWIYIQIFAPNLQVVELMHWNICRRSLNRSFCFTDWQSEFKKNYFHTIV